MNIAQPLRSAQGIRICLVENDTLGGDGLAPLVSGTCGLTLVNAYRSWEEALKNLCTDAPDILLMDVTWPGKTGIEAIARVKKLRPKTKVLVITLFDDSEFVFGALGAGAGGYLTKNQQPAKLLEAIWEIQAGGAPMSTHIAHMVVASFRKNDHSPLTGRETEVLELLAKGKSYTSIAGQLFVDKETVRTHIKNIYWKLDVHSKADAIEKARKDRLI